MKTNHLNAIINSFIVISETEARLTPTKGEVSKTDKLETKKPYIMFLKVDGEIQATIAIAIDENTLIGLSNQLEKTGRINKELNMDVINNATEYIGKIKANITSRFKDMEVDIGFERADFIMSDELPSEEETFIRVIAETHVGEFELNLKTKKNQA